MKQKMIKDLELIKRCRTRSELCVYADNNKWRKMGPLMALFKKYLLELGIDYDSYPKDETERIIRIYTYRRDRINEILNYVPTKED